MMGSVACVWLILFVREFLNSLARAVGNQQGIRKQVRDKQDTSVKKRKYGSGRFSILLL